MIDFKHIADTDIIYKYNPQDFPLVFEYLYERNYMARRELFWYEIIDITENTELDYDNGNVIGIICLYPNRILPNSINISVLEIKGEYQRQGYGKEAMVTLIDIFEKSDVRVLTLQARTPELLNFYTPLGFSESSSGEFTYLRRYYPVKK